MLAKRRCSNSAVGANKVLIAVTETVDVHFAAIAQAVYVLRAPLWLKVVLPVRLVKGILLGYRYLPTFRMLGLGVRGCEQMRSGLSVGE